MLVFQVWTWDHAKTDQLRKMAPIEGKKKEFHAIKVRGKWYEKSGTRLFLLAEVKDPAELNGVNGPWLEHGAKVETFEVDDAIEVDKLARTHGHPTELSAH